MLVNSFVHDLRETSGKRVSGVTPEVMDLLMRYEWPGNVRELKSTLEYGVAIAGSGLIGIEHLPAQFRPLIESRQNTSPKPEAMPEPSDPPEKLALIAALRKANGNQTHAAKASGRAPDDRLEPDAQVRYPVKRDSPIIESLDDSHSIFYMFIDVFLKLPKWIGV